MNRDEILEAITQASTSDAPLYQYEIADRMREVARLADTYMNDNAGDVQYLAESVTSAMGRLADMVLGSDR